MNEIRVSAQYSIDSDDKVYTAQMATKKYIVSLDISEGFNRFAIPGRMKAMAEDVGMKREDIIKLPKVDGCHCYYMDL